jgi:protein TonB
MFADSLLECAPQTELRRRVAVLLSCGVQLTAMAVALLIPLLRLERLPRVSIVPTIAMPVHRGEATATSRASTEVLAPRPVVQFIVPRTFSRTTTPQTNPGPEAPGPDVGLPGLRDDALPLVNLVNPPSSAVHMDLAPAPSHLLRISHMEPGSLIRRVQPIYPEPAKRAGIQGFVILKAVIAKDGSIEQLQVLNGHPLLARAALQAVHDWRYRPYILNGNAVEVETTITVSFSLKQN